MFTIHVLVNLKGHDMSQTELQRRHLQSVMAKQQNQQTDFLLRRREVEKQSGLSRASIYRKIAAGQFPPPVCLGGTSSVRWRQSSITEWMQSLTTKAGV
jgi:prophage regulatory protein